MAKDNTKTILIIAGIAGGIYLLTRPSVQEKVQEVIAGGGVPGIQSLALQMPAPDLTGLLSLLTETVGGTCFPNGLLPDFNIPDAGLGDLLGGLDEIFKPGGAAAGPPEHASWADVAYSLPSWAKGALGVGATALGGYGGYHLIRAFAPLLRAIGMQSARAIGGAGTVLKNLLTRSVVPRVSGQVIKSVPVATGARAGILGGVLPALAVTGIIEGGYQIVRTIRGEQNIGMTGVPPLDIINWITGRAKPGQPTPSLLFGGGPVGAAQEPAAQGGTPASVMPSFIQPQLVAGQTTPLAVQLPELKFPSYTAAEGQQKAPRLTPEARIMEKILAQE